MALVDLYGDKAVLARARRELPGLPAISAALANLEWLASHLDGVGVSYDLADMRGYAYYSGARFSIYASGAGDALVRGGRYDEVGAMFGRNRPGGRFQPGREGTGRGCAATPPARCDSCALGRGRRTATGGGCIARPGADGGVRAARARQRG